MYNNRNYFRNAFILKINDKNLVILIILLNLKFRIVQKNTF